MHHVPVEPNSHLRARLRAILVSPAALLLQITRRRAPAACLVPLPTLAAHLLASLARQASLHPYKTCQTASAVLRGAPMTLFIWSVSRVPMAHLLVSRVWVTAWSAFPATSLTTQASSNACSVHRALLPVCGATPLVWHAMRVSLLRDSVLLYASRALWAQWPSRVGCHSASRAVPEHIPCLVAVCAKNVPPDCTVS